VAQAERRARPGELTGADHGQVDLRAQLRGQARAAGTAEHLVRAPQLTLELLGELRRTREVDGRHAGRRARTALGLTRLGQAAVLRLREQRSDLVVVERGAHRTLPSVVPAA
jgi:hypothetical protein